jgi:hypothetical protein
VNININQFFQLSIDKLSITYRDPQPINVQIVNNRLVEAVESGQYPGSRRTWGKKYKHQIEVPILGDYSNPGTLLFQTGPFLPGAGDYRLEFNPARVGPAGVASVIDIMDSISGGNGKEFFYNGTVTRIDIALDLPNLSLNDLIIWKKQQRIHGIYTNQKGNPATIYLGQARSSPTAVYGKSEKNGDPYLRIEARPKPRCHGHDLAQLRNPFDKLRMVHTSSLLPLIDEPYPETFIDSIRLRGFGHALSTRPLKQRRAIKALLDEPSLSLLPTSEQIWEQWPSLLNDTGFGFLVPLAENATQLAPDPANSSGTPVAG